MPINYSQKIIFIHIPKCAGTSVERILQIKDEKDFYTEKLTSNILAELALKNFTDEDYKICASKNKQHYTYKELSKILSEDILKNFTKFSIVRNPYDRLVSEYYFREKSVKLHKNFEDFAKNVLKLNRFTRNWLYDGHLETQSSYLINEENNFNSIDKIFKFEKLNECAAFLTGVTGDKNMPHLRKTSNRKPYEEYYTQELKEIVYNFYKEDFINFNYSA